MVKFEDVDPEMLDQVERGWQRRGRVSWPILKMFLETKKFMVKLDITDTQRKSSSLYSSLNTYIKNHDLKVKVLSIKGDLYLKRTDIDKDGNPIAPGEGDEILPGKEPVDVDQMVNEIDAGKRQPK